MEDANANAGGYRAKMGVGAVWREAGSGGRDLSASRHGVVAGPGEWRQTTRKPHRCRSDYATWGDDEGRLGRRGRSQCRFHFQSHFRGMVSVSRVESAVEGGGWGSFGAEERRRDKMSRGKATVPARGAAGARE